MGIPGNGSKFIFGAIPCNSKFPLSCCSWNSMPKWHVQTLTSPQFRVHNTTWLHSNARRARQRESSDRHSFVGQNATWKFNLLAWGRTRSTMRQPTALWWYLFYHNQISKKPHPSMCRVVVTMFEINTTFILILYRNFYFWICSYPMY